MGLGSRQAWARRRGNLNQALGLGRKPDIFRLGPSSDHVGPALLVSVLLKPDSRAGAYGPLDPMLVQPDYSWACPSCSPSHRYGAMKNRVGRLWRRCPAWAALGVGPNGSTKLYNELCPANKAQLAPQLECEQST